MAAAASGTVAATIIDQDLIGADFGLPTPSRRARSDAMTEQSTSGTATAFAPEAARGNLPLAATGLALGVLMSVRDQTVVAIALPHITADLGGADQASWIVAVYVLASTASGTPYGRLSDRFGRRGAFLFAVTLFTVASLLCAELGYCSADESAAGHARRLEARGATGVPCLTGGSNPLRPAPPSHAAGKAR